MRNKKIIYFIMFSLLIASTGIILILNDKPKEKPDISDKTIIQVNSGDGNNTSDVENVSTITETTSVTTEKVIESTKKAEVEKDVQQSQVPSSFIPIVNLNLATVEELVRLPNIDAEMANKIIELRNTIQYFSHPYELLYADGMTEKRLSEIIDYVVVG